MLTLTFVYVEYELLFLIAIFEIMILLKW